MATKKLYLDRRTLVSGDSTLQKFDNPLDLKEYIQDVVDDSTTDFTSLNVDTINESTVAHGVIVDGVTLKDGGVTLADASNVIVGSTTGTKIATATSQKLGFWNATPVVQPTTAISAASFVANTSGVADDTATFGGYTIGQVVAALKAAGLLA